jgi:hypothetical protein
MIQCLESLLIYGSAAVQEQLLLIVHITIFLVVTMDRCPYTNATVTINQELINPEQRCWDTHAAAVARIPLDARGEDC